MYTFYGSVLIQFIHSRSVHIEFCSTNSGEDTQDEDARILSTFTMRPVNNFGSNVPKTLPLDSTNLGLLMNHGWNKI